MFRVKDLGFAVLGFGALGFMDSGQESPAIASNRTRPSFRV